MTSTRIRLLGGEMDLMTADDLFAFLAERIERARAGAGGAVVANHNLHSLRLIARDPAMRAFYAEADRVEIDSMPLIAWGRLLKRGTARAHRLTYLDWRERFWTTAAGEGWRVFHLGCAPGVGERALDAIGARHPGLTAATRHGFFDADGAENDVVLGRIRAFKPDVLLVGMGMPRQEAWILKNRDALPDCVILPVGGALAYDAGAVATAPRWTGRLGVEWLWRFGTEPRRLFHRYFVEPWGLAPQALADLAARRA